MRPVKGRALPVDDVVMINKALVATVVVGGAVLAVAGSASAGHADRRSAGVLCAAPWQWNGPLSLLHDAHAAGSCAATPAGGGSDISVLDDACSASRRWSRPLEIFTVDRSPTGAACDAGPTG